jgi:uncharacterized secreted repeat protein (TIGR03808 family)
MHFDRRVLLSTGLATGLAATTAAAATPRRELPADGPMFSISPDDGADQSAALQAAIDEAAARHAPLYLAPGVYRIGGLTLRPGTRLIGAARDSVLSFSGGASFIGARGASGIRLERLTIDGNRLAIDAAAGTGLVALGDCSDAAFLDLEIRNGLLSGIALSKCSGSVSACTISGMSEAALTSLDAQGLTVSQNSIRDCGNNGIQIWRSTPGEDGSIVTGNRIERITARSGGTGQNGNGISVFRAGSVIVSSNQISDCVYSAVRGNSASNIQMTGNACRTIGEVALYAEFAFEGAMIANNVVDGAASGIAVTNFNEGGRLAVVQGNLVRNLFRREQEPVDKRGIGIAVEADTVVAGNVIEGAPTAGISAGWGAYLRNVSITGNLIRASGIGILISSDPQTGMCLVSQNMISDVKDGAIRAMDHGVAQGPDLAITTPPANGRHVITGNIAV